MIRSVIFLLLFALFFLTGMLYGMDRENYAMPNSSVNQEETVPDTAPEKEPIAIEEAVNETVTDQNLHSPESESKHFTEKAASFLGTAVKAFYDVVVQILYQISQLFF